MSEGLEKIRLFVGIPLPNEFKIYLTRFKQANKQLENLRWLPFENLHVTLFFIGATKLEELNRIIKILSDISANSVSFSLQFETSFLAPKRNPRMIWAKYQSSEAFSRLTNKIASQLAYLRKPDHPPTPHITLARSKRYLQKVKLKQIDPLPDIPVSKIVLWQSVTHVKGAEYIPLQTFSLLGS